MGNTYSTQDVYKICTECNKQNIINKNIKIINSYFVKYDCSTEYILMCSQGHIFKYNSLSFEEDDEIDKYFADVNRTENEISKLKSENAKLKKEITTMREKLNNQKVYPSIAIKQDF